MKGKHSKSISEQITDSFKPFLPAKKDGFLKFTGKILYLILIFVLVFSAVWYTSFFVSADKQRKIIDDARYIWYGTQSQVTKYKRLKGQNSDFSGWLTVPNTNIDNPVYQSDKDGYYKNHNLLKKHSRYGALYILKNKNSHLQNNKNTVICGNSLIDGSMFGTLKNYRDLKFYRKNPTVTFTADNKRQVYIVYSVFVTAEDSKYINIYKSSFDGKKQFLRWVERQKQKSIINTKIDVNYSDKILTLVTDVKDFEGAKLVVCARSLRPYESENKDVSNAVINN